MKNILFDKNYMPNLTTYFVWCLFKPTWFKIYLVRNLFNSGSTQRAKSLFKRNTFLQHPCHVLWCLNNSLPLAILQLQTSSDLHGCLTFVLSLYSFWIFSPWHLNAWYHSSMCNTLRYVTVLLSLLHFLTLREQSFPDLLHLRCKSWYRPIFWTQKSIKSLKSF